jgi:undecaprenyl phosphate-alpha-L-ara4N flippase subunit ArnE
MIESLRNNKKGILLMALSALLASFGQMFWKMYHTEGLWALILGFVLYAGGALLMIIAYKYGRLSVLQPMICLSYVFAIFISVFILQETLTPLRLAGILVVVFGVVMIGGGDEEPAAVSDKGEGESR